MTRISRPSGIRQTLTDIAAGRIIKIDESSGSGLLSEGGSALRQANLPAEKGLWPFVPALATVIFAVAHTVGAQAAPSRSSLGAAQSPANSPKALADARSLVAAGNFNAAESALHIYLVRDPRSGHARYLLAYALLRQNRPKDSLEEYTRAAALQTPTAAQLREVAQDYVLLDDTADAAKWILRSIEMNGADPEGWYSLGRLRYTEQRFGDALDCFKRAIALAPGSVKVENNLGLAYEGLNRTDDAVIAYRQAIAWQDAEPSGKASEQPLLNLAIVLRHQGKLAEAKPLLLCAVRIAPQDPRIHEQLGHLFAQQGNYGEAAKYLETATRLDPEKSNLHYLLGQAYRHLGRETEAKTEFDAAARLANPSANR
jgi:Flp pilus assembly protein TadD